MIMTRADQAYHRLAFLLAEARRKGEVKGLYRKMIAEGFNDKEIVAASVREINRQARRLREQTRECYRSIEQPYVD